MKENERVAEMVAEIKVEDASKCGSKITCYSVWHKIDGVKWNGGVLFRTKEDALDQILRMPKYYEEEGDPANAESWKKGEHVIVPVEIPVPNGMEE